MPDDLQIPIVTAGPGGRAPTSTFYHPRASARRASRGVSPQAVMVAGGAACAVLLAGVGGWALLHRGPAQVPVIEADSRPVRVKPENPGGMQIAEGDDAGGPQAMAPPAEVPAPQALRAQLQLPPTPAAPAVVPDAASPAPAPTVAAGTSPLPDTPKPIARSAQPTVAARPTPAPASGGTVVQVAAVDSEAAAQAEWQRLAKKMPDLLGDRRPLVQKAERDGKTIWRVRVPGFSDVADATGFCTKLRAKGGSCAIASF